MANGFLLGCDLLWFLMVGSVWGHKAEENEEIWDTFSFAHRFALFISFINLLIRVSIAILGLFKPVFRAE